MSGAYVGGFPDGGFQRVRDNAGGGFAAELNRQKKLKEDRLAKQQAEQDRLDRKQADEEAKRKASRDAEAAKAFREYHNNPKSRGGLGSISQYTTARFGIVYETTVKQALAELRDPEMLRQYLPERFERQQGEAELKADYAKHPKCKFCRHCYGTDAELTAHLRDTRPCPRCKSCSGGGQVHICHAPCPHCVDGDTYNCPAFERFHRIEEDRVPAVKYEEIGEE